MNKWLTVPALALALISPVWAADAGAVLGGAIGGGAGAAIGQKLGGKDGAIIGGAIGGATGAAIGSKDERRDTRVIRKEKVVVRDRYYRDDDDFNPHERGRKRGHHKHKHHGWDD